MLVDLPQDDLLAFVRSLALGSPLQPIMGHQPKPVVTLLQELVSRLRSLCRFLSNYADRQKEQRRKAKAKPISYFGHASLNQGFGQLDSRGRPNPAAKRQRLDDPVSQEEDRYMSYCGPL